MFKLGYKFPEINENPERIEFPLDYIPHEWKQVNSYKYIRKNIF
jgi:hypothetical protein